MENNEVIQKINKDNKIETHKHKQIEWIIAIIEELIFFNYIELTSADYTDSILDKTDFSEIDDIITEFNNMIKTRLTKSDEEELRKLFTLRSLITLYLS